MCLRPPRLPVQLLALCGPDVLRAEVNPAAVGAYLRGLQRADGAFMGDSWGEVDTRFSYCARQAAALVMSTDAYAPPGTDSNTSAIRSVLRAMPNTVAPLRANSWATEAPSPDDAPVTRATFPSSEWLMFVCPFAASL